MDRLEARTIQYESDYKKFGYSPNAMMMPSDRRNIRYFELIKNYSFFYNRNERFTILDCGCGFGDVLRYLEHLGIHNYRYIGVDIVDSFLNKAKELYADDKRVSFIKRDFFNDNMNDFEYDYVISSQTFNNCYSDKSNNEDIIENFMKRMYYGCGRGISFNFVIDRVDKKNNGVAYHDPVRILEKAYSLTNCVVMDNLCMPFECTCTLIKEQITSGKILGSFVNKHKLDFDNGIFVIKDNNG